jgi:hypothetical protein
LTSDILIVINSGLPSEMDEDELEDDDVLEANNMAALQHANGYRPRASALSFYPDPAGGGSGRISAADLNVLKEKFPQLCNFSTEFLQSRTMDELLRIASTSLRIKDAERARETEDRLAANKSALNSKFFEVQAGVTIDGASSTQPDFCPEQRHPPPPSTSGPGRFMG